MKKILFYLSYLLTSFIGYSQVKTIEIPTDKRIIEYIFGENGNVYLQLGEISEFVGTPQNKNLLEFDKELNKIHDIDLSKIVSSVEGFASCNGNLKGFYKQGLTYSSAWSTYFINNDKYDDSKIKIPLKDIIKKINTEDYFVTYGSTENRGNKKILKGEENENLALFIVSNKNLSNKLIKLNLPNKVS